MIQEDAIFPTECNEINAFKLAVVKSLSSLSHGSRGKYVNIKTCAVDLPLSPKNMKQHFAVQHIGEEPIKFCLPVSAFDGIFGENWHIFHFPNSSTRKRIIGVIELHYRMKKFQRIKQEYQIR